MVYLRCTDLRDRSIPHLNPVGPLTTSCVQVPEKYRVYQPSTRFSENPIIVIINITPRKILEKHRVTVLCEHTHLILLLKNERAKLIIYSAVTLDKNTFENHREKSGDLKNPSSPSCDFKDRSNSKASHKVLKRSTKERQNDVILAIYAKNKKTLYFRRLA